MDLALRIREYALTSLPIARNCNSVQHICLNCNVNTYEYLKNCLCLAYLKIPASEYKFITQTRPSVHAVFFVQHAQRNTADDRSDRSAASKSDREVYLLTVQLALSSSASELTILLTLCTVNLRILNHTK
jgi:hypothetical protein